VSPNWCNEANGLLTGNPFAVFPRPWYPREVRIELGIQLELERACGVDDAVVELDVADRAHSLDVRLLRLAGWTNIKQATEKIRRRLDHILTLLGV
jgi:hypothetical protein